MLRSIGFSGWLRLLRNFEYLIATSYTSQLFYLYKGLIIILMMMMMMIISDFYSPPSPEVVYHRGRKDTARYLFSIYCKVFLKLHSLTLSLKCLSPKGTNKHFIISFQNWFSSCKMRFLIAVQTR